MKFSCSVEINASLDRVIELFDSSENLKEWQPDFVSFEHISGTPGEVGAKSRIIYLMGPKKEPNELIETITVKNLPHEFSGTYEHKHMKNTMRNLFSKIDYKRTKYVTEVEYTQFNGFFIKIMAWLFPNMFKKQVQLWMNRFKDFVEKS